MKQKLPVDERSDVKKIPAFKLSKNHIFITERGRQEQIIKIVRPQGRMHGACSVYTPRYPEGLHFHPRGKVRVKA